MCHSNGKKLQERSYLMCSTFSVMASTDLSLNESVHRDGRTEKMHLICLFFSFCRN